MGGWVDRAEGRVEGGDESAIRIRDGEGREKKAKGEESRVANEREGGR